MFLPPSPIGPERHIGPLTADVPFTNLVMQAWWDEEALRQQ
jgi:hypothetical protein